MRRTVLIVMGGVLLLAAAGCVANPVTGKSQLDLISSTVPLVAFILGLVMAGVGAFLVLGARREGDAA